MYKYNMSIANFQAKLGSMGSASIIADSSPQPMPDENGRPGWSYTKMMGAEKFNYYFYSGAYENTKLRDIKGVWFVGAVDHWTNKASELPWFVVYTKPTGVDDASWYHSAVRHQISKHGNIIRAGERCLWKVGFPDVIVEGARVLKMDTTNVVGDYNEDDEILAISLHSNSGATAMSCYVENMGVEFHQHHRHTKETLINLKLLG
tara:strand:- start:1323 stop:1937 length:615 start_codon:yes stop_codon:yes gene_type:complete